MQLPDKTFLKKQCQLFESDFQCNRQIKPLRTMQLLQDAATTHAEKIGLGWNAMDSNGMLWILGKIKIDFYKPITIDTQEFSLYTWPLAPTKYYAERCFVAKKNGEQLFSSTSMWMLLNRDSRKIENATRMNEFFHGQYSDVHSDSDSNFQRVRLDGTFTLSYERTIRRSDLDKNGHVNNTYYVDYATDVLPVYAEILSVEIVYNKELKFGDKVQVFSKQQGNTVYVVGQREETCFTAVITLA